jgi:glucans biosynthesis protein C
MTVTALSSTEVPAVASRPRLLYIDNLRTLLISLLVAGHLAITYGGTGAWIYKEPGEMSDWFVILMLPLGAILTASMLGLFSFIAGFFTPPAYNRKGLGRFLLERLRRLAIPLLFYEMVIDPLVNYLADLNKGSFAGSFWSYLGVFFVPLRSIAAGPVWFLFMLLVFSIVYAGWRLLTAWRAGRRAPKPSAAGREARVPGNGTIAWFAFILGLVTFVVRIPWPVGYVVEPWHQEPAHYPQYIAMFVAGMLAYRGGWLQAFSARQARLWVWLSPLVLVTLAGVAGAAGAFSGGLDERAAGGLNLLSFAYSMWEAWTCVIVSILMLVWFRRSFDGQRPLARTLAGAAFGVYVLHPAVIVPLAIGLSGIQMNLSLKFLWVTPLALVLCYALVYLLRRVPGVRELL